MTNLKKYIYYIPYSILALQICVCWTKKVFSLPYNNQSLGP